MIIPLRINIKTIDHNIVIHAQNSNEIKNKCHLTRVSYFNRLNIFKDSSQKTNSLCSLQINPERAERGNRFAQITVSKSKTRAICRSRAVSLLVLTPMSTDMPDRSLRLVNDGKKLELTFERKKKKKKRERKEERERERERYT